MKILHVLGNVGRLVHNPDSHALAGIGNAILHVAAKQSEQGHDVSICGFSEPYPTGRSTWHGLEIQTIRRWQWAKLTERLDASLLLPTFRQVIKHRPVDVLHVHELGLLHLPAGKIRLMHLHIPMGSDMKRSHLWKKADGLICVSAYLRNKFLSNVNFPPDRTFVVHNGAEENPIPELEAFKERRKLGILDEEVMLLFVGALTPEKGPHILLRALQHLKDHSPGIFTKIKTIFVGGAQLWRAKKNLNQANAFERELIEQGQRLKAKFLGLLPHQSVDLLFKSCDIAIVPSTIPESHPLVLCEAMAARKPIIASRIGGIPETVEGEKIASLITPGDHIALAQALRTLVEAPDLRRKMGAAALQRSRLFTWQKAAQSLDDIYQTLLEKQSRGCNKDD